ncbi:forkhead box protein [Holotrichia oblita]|uniref:Forkhead box protein n=2 Tax=Holotrichia oblita TaxID=644536 RepID=A0ACB9TRS9_HOLOL|nr:hypothetical protein MML48_1g00134 [Holotrichia oblita]KAI4469483.1 forkhead box protein [Holotrichia oblita]
MDIANMIFFDEDDDDALFGEDLEVLDIIDFGFPRRIYPRSNHFHQMDELTFFQRFRLRKETVLNILINIEDQLEYASDMNNSVTPMDQLLTSLRFYASAGHLASIADFMGMHLSTASRVIQRVSRVLANLSQQHIHMPAGNDLARVQNEFYNIARFVRVVGCVDGTHIRINSPGTVIKY